LATYRSAVTVIQRAELVERIGRLVSARAMTLGDEGRIVAVQLNDLLLGVDHTIRLVLLDYVRPVRPGVVDKALETLDGLSGSDLEDPSRVGKELGFPDLDDPAEPRGHRVLSQVGRLPESVREEIVRRFGSVSKLLRADEGQLVTVEGVGETRAAQLLAFFSRLQTSAQEWETFLD
ncbi:MAG: DNA integrity scanning protein DisA, partial [Actinobacteria bacterium]|nr:DNA integrity scanning protein DisA [Actinomycetota bacterium]